MQQLSMGKAIGCRAARSLHIIGMVGKVGLLLNSTQNIASSCRKRLLASRIIILLTFLLLLVMPVTEHLWSGDGFLLSGHDFELGLLGTLVFCGLVSLAAHQIAASPRLFALIALERARLSFRRLLPPSLELVSGVAALLAFARHPDLSISSCLLSLRI